MRLFIVSNEIPPERGVVVGLPHEAKAEAVANECFFRAAREKGCHDVESFDFIVRMTAVVSNGSLFRDGIIDKALKYAYRQGIADANWQPSKASERLLGGAIVSGDPLVAPKYSLPFEQHCVTVMLNGGVRAPVSVGVKLFCGAFSSDAQLQAVLAEDGGNSRIHIFNRGYARSLFWRHGGGILEDGVYLLHPKRENVLVPFRSFHTDMLQEMTREVRVVMGRIGARKLVVETVEGVTFSGSVVSRVPLKSGGVEVEAKENAERRMTYEWGSPTFEPERALEDCVWIRDNAGAMTIVDQRRTSNLVRFEEFSRVDTSFRVGLDLMKLFEAKFAWASTSTYRYAVDFFPRR